MFESNRLRQLMKTKALNILIIEGKQQNTDAIGKCLGQSSSINYNVTLVDRLVDGLGVLSLQPVDIIVLGANLPDNMEKTGIKLIKEHKPNIPLLILTEQSSTDHEYDLIEMGVQDYLYLDNIELAALENSIKLGIARQNLINRYKSTIKELNNKIEDLEKMNDMMVDREIVITNLKRELREVQKKISQ